LVWGFPQYLSEDSKLGPISYPQFHHAPPPQKYDFVLHWLKTGFWLPEGNFCVRREVFDRCFPRAEEFSVYKDCFLEFNHNFNTLGYLPYHIGEVANFGRTHRNQEGEKERVSGLMRVRVDAYFRKVRNYRWKLLAGFGTHVYRDGKHSILPIEFSNQEFRRQYRGLLFADVVHFVAGNYIGDRLIAFAKKSLPSMIFTRLKGSSRRVV